MLNTVEKLEKKTEQKKRVQQNRKRATGLTRQQTIEGEKQPIKKIILNKKFFFIQSFVQLTVD